MVGLKTKAANRMAGLRRVSNTTWAITTHALLDSFIKYGLAIYGAHIRLKNRDAIAFPIMTPGARRIVATGPQNSGPFRHDKLPKSLRPKS